MRLGRFVDYVKSVLESFHIPNRRIGTLFGLIAVCQSLFMLFDNLLLKTFPSTIPLYFSYIGMRLGRFVDYVKSVLESFHIPNRRIGTLFGLIAVCQSLFMLFDNYCFIVLKLFI